MDVERGLWASRSTQIGLEARSLARLSVITLRQLLIRKQSAAVQESRTAWTRAGGAERSPAPLVAAPGSMFIATFIGADNTSLYDYGRRDPLRAAG